MELEKRKRVSDGEPPPPAGIRAKAEEDGGGAASAPSDEEVEEFFAILRRIQVALKYFQKRDGGSESTATPAWSPSFEQEDFNGVEKSPSPEKPSSGLDLNSEPAISDEH